MLLAVLADNGRVDMAYRLLLQPTSPSWMAQIGKGATTIWETWAGYDKAGRAKSSHNHYAVGSVALWLHEYIAGLRPAEPGYRHIRIAPHIGGGLTSASSTITTPYGMASSTWSVVDETVQLDVCVPTGTTAEVQAGVTVHRVAAGEHSFSYASG
jgi:alpha-L-rhamnosidase